MNAALGAIVVSALLGATVVGAGTGDGVASDQRTGRPCPDDAPEPAVVPPNLFIPIVTSAVVDGSAEEQAALAFLAARRAIVDARSAADSAHPDLLATMTGDTLSAMQALIEDARAQCRGVRTSVAVVLGDVAVVGPTATVEFCAIEDSEWFDLVTGERSGDSDAVYQYGIGHLEKSKDHLQLAANDPVYNNCDAMNLGPENDRRVNT